MTIKHPHMLLRVRARVCACVRLHPSGPLCLTFTCPPTLITPSNTNTPINKPVLAVPADVDDIDAADRVEPLACVDYVEDQYRHYREKECRPG